MLQQKRSNERFLDPNLEQMTNHSKTAIDAINNNNNNNDEELKARKAAIEQEFSILFRQKEATKAELEARERERLQAKEDLWNVEDDCNELLALLPTIRLELDAAKERKVAAFKRMFPPENKNDFVSKEVTANAMIVANIERLKTIRSVVRDKAARAQKVTIGTQTEEDVPKEVTSNEVIDLSDDEEFVPIASTLSSTTSKASTSSAPAKTQLPPPPKRGGRKPGANKTAAKKKNDTSSKKKSAEKKNVLKRRVSSDEQNENEESNESEIKVVKEIVQLKGEEDGNNRKLTVDEVEEMIREKEERDKRVKSSVVYNLE